ncbi:hypothetical protein [Glaciimonas sp. PCH181]|uniref:hypothetical protein n=1 Tax=Glaciimonas sp. PCH181 TaxID=2133943 RepID=UPI0013750F87|nr:hypothetical protein [Glaciimonas sp. PCH181]
MSGYTSLSPYFLHLTNLRFHPMALAQTFVLGSAPMASAAGAATDNAFIIKSMEIA